MILGSRTVTTPMHLLGYEIYNNPSLALNTLPAVAQFCQRPQLELHLENKSGSSRKSVKVDLNLSESEVGNKSHVFTPSDFASTDFQS